MPLLQVMQFIMILGGNMIQVFLSLSAYLVLVFLGILLVVGGANTQTKALGVGATVLGALNFVLYFMV